MVDNDVLILQNCIGSLKVEPVACSETRLTSSHNENQFIDIKVEVGSNAEEEEEEEEEDPLLIPFKPVKSEYEVSVIC